MFRGSALAGRLGGTKFGPGQGLSSVAVGTNSNPPLATRPQPDGPGWIYQSWYMVRVRVGVGVSRDPNGYIVSIICIYIVVVVG